jgi:hypothetical protein
MGALQAPKSATACLRPVVATPCYRQLLMHASAAAASGASRYSSSQCTSNLWREFGAEHQRAVSASSCCSAQCLGSATGSLLHTHSSINVSACLPELLSDRCQLEAALLGGRGLPEAAMVNAAGV